MNVKFLDLSPFWSKHRDKLHEVVEEVGASGRYLNASWTERFENRFKAICQSKYCVSVHSGLDALKISLLAVGVKPNDRVLVSSHTFIATFLAIRDIGAVPVPVDSCPLTLNVDLTKLKASLDSSIKAVLVVNMYGNPINLKKFYQQLREEGIPLLQDQAQSVGAVMSGRNVCLDSDVSAFSFYPGKNLGGFGDGGAIVTNSLDIANCARKYANYGQSRKYHHTVLGYNSRLGELQAALLEFKLKHELAANNDLRKKQAEIYFSKITNTWCIYVPSRDHFRDSVFHLFPILITDSLVREKFMEYMDMCGVETIIHYPIPPHRQVAFQGYFDDIALSVTDDICDRVVSLPIGPHLSMDQVLYVIESVNSFTSKFEQLENSAQNL